jgi:hypothetical protein
MSNRILRPMQADSSSNHGRLGIHPSQQPVNSFTRQSRPEIPGPFRARRDKTTFPRVNPGLYFFGPLGHSKAQKFLRRPLSRNVQTAGPFGP